MLPTRLLRVVVRVRAGAFGSGRPTRDLWLSPDHAVLIGDVLIPVKYLINALSIDHVPVGTITYYHVELDAHDVLLAEGAAAEPLYQEAIGRQLPRRSVTARSPGASQ